MLPACELSEPTADGTASHPTNRGVVGAAAPRVYFFSHLQRFGALLARPHVRSCKNRTSPLALGRGRPRNAAVITGGTCTWGAASLPRSVATLLQGLQHCWHDSSAREWLTDWPGPTVGCVTLGYCWHTLQTWALPASQAGSCTNKQ